MTIPTQPFDLLPVFPPEGLAVRFRVTLHEPKTQGSDSRSPNCPLKSVCSNICNVRMVAPKRPPSSPANKNAPSPVKVICTRVKRMVGGGGDPRERG